MNEASITRAIRESLLAMEQGCEHEIVEINVLLKREDRCSFVESTPREHEVTVAISYESC